MASETDIKRMLIDALRPSLFEVVKQELNPLAEIRAEIAKGEAALNRRIDEVSSQMSGAISDRVDVAFKDLQRHFEEAIGARLTSVAAQLQQSQAAIDALGDELRRALTGAAARADRLDRRLGAAAAALRDGATEPAEAAPEPQHRAPAGD